jgi:RNA polymerase sigma factor (sigma-70 family)
MHDETSAARVASGQPGDGAGVRGRCADNHCQRARTLRQRHPGGIEQHNSGWYRASTGVVSVRFCPATDVQERRMPVLTFTVAPPIGAEDRGYAAAEASAIVDDLLARLSQRERLALQLRFREDMTQAEIGQRLGCSQMHVSRILRKALARLGEQGPRNSELSRG